MTTLTTVYEAAMTPGGMRRLYHNFMMHRSARYRTNWMIHSVINGGLL